MAIEYIDLKVPTNFDRFLEKGGYNLNKISEEPKKLLRLYIENVKEVRNDSTASSLKMKTMKTIELALINQLEGYHLFKFRCHYRQPPHGISVKDVYLLEDLIEQIENHPDAKSITQLKKALTSLSPFLNSSEIEWVIKALKKENPDLSSYTELGLEQFYHKLQVLKLNSLCKILIDKTPTPKIYLKRTLPFKNPGLAEYILSKMSADEFTLKKARTGI